MTGLTEEEQEQEFIMEMRVMARTLRGMTPWYERARGFLRYVKYRISRWIKRVVD